MFIKLLRLDFRFGARKFLTLSLVAFASVSLLCFLPSKAVDSVLPFAIAALAAVSGICVLLVIQQYEKSLFGDECHFMMTLPVHPWQIVLSKYITACVWFTLMAVSVALPQFAWDVIRRSGMENAFWQCLKEYLNYTLDFLRLYLMGPSAIIAVYFSVSLGHFAFRHRTGGMALTAAASVLLGGFCLWGAAILPEIISGMHGEALPDFASAAVNKRFTVLYFGSAYLFEAIFIAVCYFLSVRCLRRKGAPE